MSDAAPNELTPVDSAELQPARVSAWYLPVFLLLAVWSTWPLADRFKTHLPLGSKPAATVPLFNLWTVWWNADRLKHGLSGYWDAPIFHPAEDTFAFSEAQPTALIVAPVVWICDTPIPAYNIYILLNLTLNGWVAARLLAAVYGRFWPAIFGGAMMVVLPFVHWQMDVLQLVPLWGILWTLNAVWRFSEVPRLMTGIGAGVAFAVTYFQCNHWGLFFSVLLIASSAWLLGRQFRRWRSWLRLLPGIAVSVLLLAPVVTVQLRASRANEWKRDAALIQSLSAKIGDYSVPPWPELLSFGDFSSDEFRPNGVLSAGSIKLALAIVGLVGGLLIGRFRRWTVACVTIASVAVLLSMGPNFTIGEREERQRVVDRRSKPSGVPQKYSTANAVNQAGDLVQTGIVPYQWFVERYPGFAQIRNVFRFAVFVQMMIVILATGGLVILAGLAERIADRLSQRKELPPSTARRWQIAASLAVVGIAGGFGLLEIRPPEPNLYSVPDVEENRGWINWLRENTNEDDVVVAVPFTRGGQSSKYETTTVTMYWGTFHGRPMVNGYSGFFPETFVTLLQSMVWFGYQDGYGRQSEHTEALKILSKYDVRYCIVHRAEIVRRPEIRKYFKNYTAVLRRSPRLKRVFADERARVDIYRLK